MAGDKPEKGGSKLKKIIIIAVIVLLLLVIGIGAALFVTGALSKKNATAGQASHAAVVKKHPPVYFSIKPALVVNFQDPTRARYLQVSIDVMTRDPKVVGELKTNMPAIRNRLIILLSAQKYAQISTAAGKQKLRKEVLASINDVLKQANASGKANKVYFTNFVMQ